MSNEINVRASLQIQNAALVYQSQPQNFRANMAGIRGPTPGVLLVPTHGINVDLSKLDLPGGLCLLANMDPTNKITWGIFDTTFNRFYPVGDILPTEFYLLRLSYWLGTEYGTGSGSGTGTTGSGDTLHLRANVAPCVAVVSAFDA